MFCPEKSKCNVFVKILKTHQQCTFQICPGGEKKKNQIKKNMHCKRHLGWHTQSRLGQKMGKNNQFVLHLTNDKEKLVILFNEDETKDIGRILLVPAK